MAEIILGQPLFLGDSSTDQLVEIIKIIGTPSIAEINQMNPNYTEFKFPNLKRKDLRDVFQKMQFRQPNT